MNIPEHILQQVADAAFLSSNGGMMGLLTCNKEKNHVFWHEEKYERRSVIQHALDNPDLAPFLAEPAAQVPLGPEDVPPGSVFRSKDQPDTSFWTVSQVWERGFYLRGECVDWRLAMERMEINTSIPDTGRWDANAWRDCSKPAGKEVAK